ncbi:MAG: hypothetical protein ACTH9H_04470 [Galactobacter sp.]
MTSCVLAGLLLVGVAVALTVHSEAICHELYGRSISQIPFAQWPPSTLIYLSVGVLGLLLLVAGLICAGVLLARRRRK